MQRRKFIVGAGSLAVGSAAAMGTGAFTSVSATRAVDVGVADDANALLQIAPMSSDNASEYVAENNGIVEIDITSTNAGGQGVNREATTIVRDLLTISNLGTNAVYVWIQDGPDGVGFFADDTPQDAGSTGTDAGLGVGGQPSNWPLGKSHAGRQLLGPGDELNRVGLYVTDPDALESDTDTDITVWAATLDEIAFAERGGYDFAGDPDGALPNNLEGALTAEDTRVGSEFPGSFT